MIKELHYPLIIPPIKQKESKKLKKMCIFFHLAFASCTSMSLVNWLSGTGPKPGLKRKLDDATDSDSESGPDKKKKPKEMAQKNFDWYKQDESGKWHCTIC